MNLPYWKSYEVILIIRKEVLPFNHVIRNKLNCELSFHSYFIPSYQFVVRLFCFFCLYFKLFSTNACFAWEGYKMELTGVKRSVIEKL